MPIPLAVAMVGASMIPKIIGMFQDPYKNARKQLNKSISLQSMLGERSIMDALARSRQGMQSRLASQGLGYSGVGETAYADQAYNALAQLRGQLGVGQAQSLADLYLKGGLNKQQQLGSLGDDMGSIAEMLALVSMQKGVPKPGAGIEISAAPAQDFSNIGPMDDGSGVLPSPIIGNSSSVGSYGPTMEEMMGLGSFSPNQFREFSLSPGRGYSSSYAPSNMNPFSVGGMSPAPASYRGESLLQGLRSGMPILELLQRLGYGQGNYYGEANPSWSRIGGGQ